MQNVLSNQPVENANARPEGQQRDRKRKTSRSANAWGAGMGLSNRIFLIALEWAASRDRDVLQQSSGLCTAL